jgi:hypothetical protein
MTQGAIRVEEYERHFMKMKRYAPDDTNNDQKKQFWFLRGLHHSLRQALKASEHKTLCHLVNCAIAVEDEKRSHKERMRGKKRTGDQDHHNRSFQKPRSGQSNMMRRSYRPGHNQPGRGFRGGGRSSFPGGRNPSYPQQTGGYTRAPPSTTRPTAGGFTVTCFACGKPGHKSYDCPDKKATATPVRAPAPVGRPPQAAPPPPAGRGRLNHLTEEEVADATGIVIGEVLVCGTLLTVYFGTPNMFITLWFGFVYGTNPLLGTLIISQAHLCACIWKCCVYVGKHGHKGWIHNKFKGAFTESCSCS